MYETNPDDMQPGKMMPLAALLPIMLGAGALALAYGAAPGVALLRNPASLLSLAFIVYGAGLIVTALVRKCGWETSYFGLQIFCLSSLVLLGWVPVLCLWFYSSLSPGAVGVVVFAYIASHAWWCHRFVRFYGTVWADEQMRGKLYQMEEDAAYYSQRGDRFLFERKPRLAQYPSAAWFAGSILIALGTLPFVDAIRQGAGLPYSHMVLTVIGLPISMMGAGIATRGWLICFHYPRKIRRMTGRPTLVDITADLPAAG